MKRRAGILRYRLLGLLLSHQITFYLKKTVPGLFAYNPIYLQIEQMLKHHDGILRLHAKFSIYRQ